jgi:type 1 glutamine amidotransferase
MLRARLVVASIFLSCSFTGLCAQSPKKIVFVAGQKDHGVPGRHEYEKDVTVLKYCLDHSPDVKGVTTKIFTGHVPDIAELEDASAIVLESSADRLPEERHVLFPQDAATDHRTYDPTTLAYLQELDRLMKKGVGLVAFHYTTWVDNELARQYWTKWLGGYYLSGTSKYLQSSWSMALMNERHPILRGISPWTYDEEVHAYEKLAENPRRVDLIRGTTKKGESTVASWALERKGGGRSFVMTGGDFHKNLALDNYRRFLLNGIVWAAHLKVPPGGVESSVSEEIMK